jgi:hypothetical protein
MSTCTRAARQLAVADGAKADEGTLDGMQVRGGKACFSQRMEDSEMPRMDARATASVHRCDKFSLASWAKLINSLDGLAFHVAAIMPGLAMTAP